MDGVAEDDRHDVVFPTGGFDDPGVEAGVRNGVAGQVDGIADPAVGGQKRPEAVFQGLGRRRGVESPFFRLVDGQDGGAAGTGDVEDPPARGFFHVREDLGEVVKLFQVFRPVDPVFPEDGAVDLVRSGERLGVAFRGHPAPGGPPRLEDDDGFLRLGQGFEKDLGTLHPFHVKGDDARVRVFVEIPDAVRFVHVRPVSQAHEDAHAEMVLARPVHEGGAHGAALGDEGHASPGGEKGPGSAQVVMGVVDPLAVRPDNPDAVFFRRVGQFFLEDFPVLTRFGEPARDDDGGLHPRLPALFEGAGHESRGDDHNGQVRRRGRRRDVLVDLEPEDLVGFRVDGVDGAGESSVYQVVQDVVPELSRCGGSPDQGDTFRLEDGVQAFQRLHVPSCSFFVLPVSHPYER